MTIVCGLRLFVVWVLYLVNLVVVMVTICIVNNLYIGYLLVYLFFNGIQILGL